jgi:hypothetical protein
MMMLMMADDDDGLQYTTYVHRKEEVRTQHL